MCHRWNAKLQMPSQTIKWLEKWLENYSCGWSRRCATGDQSHWNVLNGHINGKRWFGDPQKRGLAKYLVLYDNSAITNFNHLDETSMVYWLKSQSKIKTKSPLSWLKSVSCLKPYQQICSSLAQLSQKTETWVRSCFLAVVPAQKPHKTANLLLPFSSYG